MGLKSAIGSVFNGNFSDAADYLFMDEDTIATKTSVDNAQEVLVKEQYAKGLIDENQQAGYLNDIQRNAYPYLFTELGGPSGAFADSIKEDVQKLPERFSAGINKTLGTALGITFRALPWYIWLILGIAGIVYIYPFLAPFRGLAKKP